jgi:hypothetical protein
MTGHSLRRLGHLTKLFVEYGESGTRKPPCIETVHESGWLLIDFDRRATEVVSVVWRTGKFVAL